MTANQEKIDGVPIVNQPTREELDKRQLVDYKEYKRKCINWLPHIGKNPERATGYARSTVRSTSQKVDLFYRWVWNEDGYTLQVSSRHADGYLRSLVYSDDEYSSAYKATTQKSLKRLFKWRNHEFGENIDWDPKHSFSADASQPQDYLTVKERQKIREAALEYSSVPSYTAVTPDERDEWSAYLAQRFGKSKSDIGPDDWQRANG